MGKFTFIPTIFEDAKLINTFVAGDVRGSFVKDFNFIDFSSEIYFECIETMLTYSKTGVIRGMHFQDVLPQAKLISCVHGEIQDIIVDIRPDSKTYGMFQSFILSDENHMSLYVPRGFAHGYFVQKDSIVSYKCDNPFYADGDSGITYDDPDLNLPWNYEIVGGKQNVILSDKDKSLMTFAKYRETHKDLKFYEK